MNKICVSKSTFKNRYLRYLKNTILCRIINICSRNFRNILETLY